MIIVELALLLLLEFFLFLLFVSDLLLDLILFIVVEVVQHALDEGAVIIILVIFIVIILISVVHCISLFDNMRSLLLKEVENLIACFRLALNLLGDIISIRLLFRAVVNKVTFSNVLGQKFFKSSEVFFAKVVPEIPVLWRNEIVIDERGSGESDCRLSVLLLVEIL